eukprot:gene13958-biopygen6156
MKVGHKEGIPGLLVLLALRHVLVCPTSCPSPCPTCMSYFAKRKSRACDALLWVARGATRLCRRSTAVPPWHTCRQVVPPCHQAVPPCRRGAVPPGLCRQWHGCRQLFRLTVWWGRQPCAERDPGRHVLSVLEARRPVHVEVEPGGARGEVEAWAVRRLRLPNEEDGAPLARLPLHDDVERDDAVSTRHLRESYVKT